MPVFVLFYDSLHPNAIKVLAYLAGSRFVLKTDVQSYCASIDHHLLLDRLAALLTDPRVLNFIDCTVKPNFLRVGI